MCMYILANNTAAPKQYIIFGKYHKDTWIEYVCPRMTISSKNKNGHQEELIS